MSVVMATEKIRMLLVVDEEVRDVLRLEKTFTGEDMSDIVARIVLAAFPESLEEVRRRKRKDKKKGDK
jgi:hypothetical protein